MQVTCSIELAFRMIRLECRNESLSNFKRAKLYDTPDHERRSSNTKITCSFTGPDPGIEYSEFVCKKVAKGFPTMSLRSCGLR